MEKERIIEFSKKDNEYHFNVHAGSITNMEKGARDMMLISLKKMIKEVTEISEKVDGKIEEKIEVFSISADSRALSVLINHDYIVNCSTKVMQSISLAMLNMKMEMEMKHVKSLLKIKEGNMDYPNSDIIN